MIHSVFEHRIVPQGLVLVAASGCAALIYEVVWFQLLGLVIGASSVSIGLLLATFMAGLCIGSLALPRLLAPRHHPLRAFAMLELGIGLFGLVILYTLPAVAGAYTAWAGAGVAGLVWRGVVAAIVLLPPTILMGATLPAIARGVATTPRGAAWLGLFYAANIGGAVLGSLLAGFYLLRVHDVGVATFVAAGLNLIVAGVSFALARGTRAGAPADALRATSGAEAALAGGSADADAAASVATPGRASAFVASLDTGAPSGAAARWPVYVTIALSGLTALSAEVVWTRQLSLLLGGTVYALSLILAVFLLGLGLGSGAGSALSQRVPARAALGWCQLGLCAGIAWGALSLARMLPYWPLDVGLPTPPWIALQLDLIRTAWTVLPAALLWGASMPLALAAVAAHEKDGARLAGGIYAANTLGAIAGALATSFVLIPVVGSRLAQQMLIVLAAGAALLLLVRGGAERLRARPWPLAAAGIGAAAALVLAAAVPELPRELVAFGRFMPTRAQGVDVLYVGEGMSASVAVSQEPNGELTYHSAGKTQASTYGQDMRLQRMLGHLTTLVRDDGRAYLVIGLGAGVTAGAVSLDPGAEHVVVAEIEPLVPEAVTDYFREQNFGVVDDPKVTIRIDDGRHYLATTEATFDGITTDPLDPWVKGAAALYTREFWELCKTRLNSGGVVTAFVQLYESTEDAVKSEIATFFEVFPNGALFANTVQGFGYDAVLLGLADDAPIDVDAIDRRLRSPEYERVARSLREVGFASALDLLGTYAGHASDLAPWLEGAAINTDRNLRLQYLAAEGLNRNDAAAIFGNMTPRAPTLPGRLFVGTPSTLEALRERVRARHP